MCRSKTHPCVPAKRPHVFNMRAVCRYTRKRSEPTHGDVSNLHAKRREGRRVREGGGSLLSLFPSLFLSSVVLFLFSLSLLSSSLSSLSNNDNDHSSSRFSLYTHGSDLPECQSAWTLAHSLFGEHVRIMQETTVLAELCKPRATGNEVGLYLCWKWVMCLCLVVFGCVSISM